MIVVSCRIRQHCHQNWMNVQRRISFQWRKWTANSRSRRFSKNMISATPAGPEPPLYRGFSLPVFLVALVSLALIGVIAPNLCTSPGTSRRTWLCRKSRWESHHPGGTESRHRPENRIRQRTGPRRSHRKRKRLAAARSSQRTDRKTTSSTESDPR